MLDRGAGQGCTAGVQAWNATQRSSLGEGPWLTRGKKLACDSVLLNCQGCLDNGSCSYLLQVHGSRV